MITAKEMRQRSVKIRKRFENQIFLIEEEIKKAADNGEVKIKLSSYQLFQFGQTEKFYSQDFQDMIIDYFGSNGFRVKFQANELYISW